MRRFLAIAAVALLAACTSPHPQAVKQAGAHEVALYVTPAVSGEANDVRVEVRGPRYPEVTAVALTMPQMSMPPQRIVLRDSGTGSYDAPNVRFSMSGTWHVSVLERRGADERELTSFDVSVR